MTIAITNKEVVEKRMAIFFECKAVGDISGMHGERLVMKSWHLCQRLNDKCDTLPGCYCYF